MNRRTRWIVVGLVVAILVVLGLAWRAVRRGARKPDNAAQRERDRVSEQRRRLAARQAALRGRLRRLHGQGQGPQTGTSLVTGLVSASDGKVIGAAEIRVVLPGGRVLKARSGPDGRYGLVGVPQMAERMEVWARGYQTRVYRPLRLPKALRVRWDVTLQSAQGVHGVVLQGKDPAPGAIVRLLRPGVRRPVQRTRTDLGGRFLLPLDGAKGGPWVVSASHAQHGRAQVSVTGPSEVTIRLPGGGFVEGHVVDDQGNPVTKFSLSSTSLARMGRRSVMRSFDSSEGTFRLGPLAAERQLLYAVASGYQPERSKPVVVRSGETVKNVVLRLGRSGELLGQVTDAGSGQPIRNARVTPTGWGSRALSRSTGVTTNAGGYYTLRSVPDSRTSLRVQASGYQPLLAGGVECSGGQQCKRNFSLTPLQQGQRGGGQLTGVGAVLRKTGDGVLIQQLLAGGPAEGVLQKGDLVVMVGDLDVTTVGLSRVAQAIRGETGTDVVLWVRRPGQTEPQRVVITRALVTMPSRHR
jgi:Carboxypeptidase regulatory-like domain/PDZ domain